MGGEAGGGGSQLEPATQKKWVLIDFHLTIFIWLLKKGNDVLDEGRLGLLN